MPLLVAADDQWFDPDAATDQQDPDAGGAADLVAAHRHQIESGVTEGEGHTADRLRRVDVQQRASAPALGQGLRHLVDGLSHPHLVVHPLAVHHPGRLVARREDGGGVDAALPVDGDRPGLAGALGPDADRGVFDGGEDLVVASRRATPAGGGDRLGGAGREHDLAGSCSQRRRHPIAGVFETSAGHERVVMDP